MIQMVDIREWRTAPSSAPAATRSAHWSRSTSAPSRPGRQTAAGSSAGGSGCWSARGRVE
jgi:hypothetical protein